LLWGLFFLWVSLEWGGGGIASVIANDCFFSCMRGEGIEEAVERTLGYRLRVEIRHARKTNGRQGRGGR